MGKKKGRPKSELSRTRRIGIRLTEDDMYTLEFIQRKTGKTKSEIIRDCFKKERDRLVNDIMNRF